MLRTFGLTVQSLEWICDVLASAGHSPHLEKVQLCMTLGFRREEPEVPRRKDALWERLGGIMSRPQLSAVRVWELEVPKNYGVKGLKVVRHCLRVIDARGILRLRLGDK